MRKNLLFVSFFILSIAIKAQSSSRWSDLFSYNNVLAIRDDSDRLIAATENGIFYYNPSTGEIKKMSKANGLHDVKITAFDYNPETRTGLIGYKSGGLDVITPNGIFYIVDIPIANGYNGDKKINHISIKGDQATISVGYGVSIFNLAKREFGDTAFFSSGGVFTNANEAGIVNNTVYVATDVGLFSHEINTTFSNFLTWQSSKINGVFKNIASKDILAYSSGNQVKYGNPASVTSLANLPILSGSFTNIKDVVIDQQKILVADEMALYQFSANGTLEQRVNYTEIINTGAYYNNTLYTGSLLNGILDKNKTSIKPDGPYNNAAFKINLFQNQIVISSGGKKDYNDPIVRNLGYYHFDGLKWNYPNYFLTSKKEFNVTDVAINPAKPSEIFFTNYVTLNPEAKGVFKFTNNEFSKFYFFDEQNGNRPAGLVFDENNNLFVSLFFIPGISSVGFAYYDKTSDNFLIKPVITNGGAERPFAKNGILYIPGGFSNTGGLLIYDYNDTLTNFSDDKYKLIKKLNNLPSEGTASVMVDKNDNVWIGNRQGVRILSNPKSAILEVSPQTEAIIIEQNGLGEELFRDSEILSIAVDSGNQKWISASGGGVFFISPNGEQTYLHFTKANSPLPNNSVTDIQIDEKTGKVYFATLDGVVVYQGDIANVSDNFGDVLVYPNPVVYSQFKGNVRIKGLAAKTNIRITDAAGNVVHSAIARGGYYEWNLNNQRGVRVASGIYFVLMTNEDGTDKATAKIAVVN